MRVTFFFLSLALFLVACDGGEASGPVDSSSSATESSETISSVAESCSSVPLSSNEVISSSEVVPVSSSLLVSSSSENVLSSSFYADAFGTMTDERDGQTYKTVTINGLTWMIQNLNYAYLQPTLDLDSSSLCYDNIPSNCDEYGRLYLWSATVDSAALFGEEGKGCGYFASEEDWHVCFTGKDKSVRGVCPEGWRLPTFNEMFDLIKWRIVGSDQGEVWFRYEDMTGETVGYYNFEDSRFHYNPGESNVWLATERSGKIAYQDDFNPAAMEYSEGVPLENAIRAEDKRNAYPVRCVKDYP